MNNEDNFINIISGETPNFNCEMSQEEKAVLTANVMAKIEKKKQQKQEENISIVRVKRRLVSLVAAAALLVASTTAIALSTDNFKKPLRKKKKPVKVTEEVKVTEVATTIPETTVQTQPATEYTQAETQAPTQAVIAEKNEQKFVCVSDGTSEDYMMVENGGGWYSFENDDKSLNFDCQVIYGGTQWSRDFIVETGIKNCKEIVPTYQWLYLDDKKALYVTYDKDWMYGHQLFVRYKNSKYALSILAPAEISKSKLFEIGKKVTLKVCPESQKSEYIEFSTFLENYMPDKMKGEIPNKAPIDYNQITYPNQVVENSQLQISVEDTRKVENIKDIVNTTKELDENQEIATEEGYGLYEHIKNNMNLFTNEDGTLSTYERSYVYTGDGINTPVQKIVYQDIKQEFHKVKLCIKNITAEKLSGLSLLYPLDYASEDENFYRDTNVYSRPAGVNSCQVNNMPKYFSIGQETLDLEANEEKYVELGYFVDEDLADSMFINILDYRVDIR